MRDDLGVQTTASHSTADLYCVELAQCRLILSSSCHYHVILVLTYKVSTGINQEATTKQKTLAMAGASSRSCGFDLRSFGNDEKSMVV